MANKTNRETWSWLIGWNCGEDENGNARIYNGGYWDPDTNKKQYEFIYCDYSGKIVSSYLTDYRGFREIIDCYELPEKPRKYSTVL